MTKEELTRLNVTVMLADLALRCLASGHGPAHQHGMVLLNLTLRDLINFMGEQNDAV